MVLNNSGSQFRSLYPSELFFFSQQGLRAYFFCLSKRNRRKKKTLHDLPFGFPPFLTAPGAPSTGNPLPALEAPLPCGAPSGPNPVAVTVLGCVEGGQGTTPNTRVFRRVSQ